MYTPNFTLNPQVVNQIAEVERIRLLVDQSKILPEKEITLRYRATVEAIHSSTTIEGNPLNKHQVEAVLAGKAVAQADYAIKEVQNYKQALDWLNKRRHQNKPISLEDILKLHALTMQGLLPKAKTGKLRPGPVYIVDILDKKEKIRYIGPEAKKLKKLLQELFIWVDTMASSHHPLLAASILHYEFVSIHPFSDGNGRVTRLLTMLYLSQRNYDFREVIVPERYYLENQLQYYNALNQAKNYTQQREADLTPWIEYFITGFLEIAKRLQAEITLAEVPALIDQTIRLSQDEIILLDFVKQMSTISLEEAIEILRIPRRTVQRRLQILVGKKLLVIRGKGKNTLYARTA